MRPLARELHLHIANRIDLSSCGLVFRANYPHAPKEGAAPAETSPEAHRGVGS